MKSSMAIETQYREDNKYRGDPAYVQQFPEAFAANGKYQYDRCKYPNHIVLLSYLHYAKPLALSTET